MPAVAGAPTRCQLLDSTIQAVDAKPKHSMLPILIVLFLISYGLLAKLVVEQGRTIDSQRSLIRQLFGDSSQLSAMNGKSAQRSEEHTSELQSHSDLVCRLLLEKKKKKKNKDRVEVK